MQSVNEATASSSSYQAATSPSPQQDGRITPHAQALLDALENGAEGNKKDTMTSLGNYMVALPIVSEEREAILCKLPRILAQLKDSGDHYEGMRVIAVNSMPRAFQKYVEPLPSSSQGLNQRQEEQLVSKSNRIAMITSLVNDYLIGKEEVMLDADGIRLVEIIQEENLGILQRIGLNVTEVRQLKNLYTQAIFSSPVHLTKISVLDAEKNVIPKMFAKVQALSATQSPGAGVGAGAGTMEFVLRIRPPEESSDRPQEP